MTLRLTVTPVSIQGFQVNRSNKKENVKIKGVGEGREKGGTEASGKSKRMRHRFVESREMVEENVFPFNGAASLYNFCAPEKSVGEPFREIPNLSKLLPSPSFENTWNATDQKFTLKKKRRRRRRRESRIILAIADNAE